MYFQEFSIDECYFPERMQNGLKLKQDLAKIMGTVQKSRGPASGEFVSCISLW